MLPFVYSNLMTAATGRHPGVTLGGNPDLFHDSNT
jgi:hypothetical protein